MINQTDTLRERFSKIYTSKDEERKKYTLLVSGAAWELIGKFSYSLFADFIEENKIDLDKYPKRSFELLEHIYYWCFVGGYFAWIAEAELSGKELTIPSVNSETLFNDWKKYGIDEYAETYNSLSVEFKDIVDSFSEKRIKQFLDNKEIIIDLSVELIDKLKLSFGHSVIHGYILGLSESKQRK